MSFRIQFLFCSCLVLVIAGVCVGISIGQGNKAKTPRPETLLPSGSVLYVGWDGNEAHQKAWEGTAAYESLYQSGLADLIKKVFVMIIRETGGDETDFLKVFNHISSKGISVSVSLPQGAGPPLPSSVVVIHQGKPLEPLLGGMIKKAVGRDLTLQARNLSGRNVTSALIPNSPGIEFGWWLEGEHLVFAAGPDVVNSTLAVADGKAPGITSDALWKQHREKTADFEVATVGWLDLGKVRRQFGEFPIPLPVPVAEPLSVNNVLEALGLEQMGPLVYRSGYKGRALVSETLVESHSPRKGLFSLADQPTMTLADLPPLPQDSGGFYARSIDWSGSYDKILSTVKNVFQLADPRAGQQVDMMVEQFTAGLGVDLKKEFFDPLGNVVCLYSDPAHGFMGFGGGLALEVDDPQTLQRTTEKLLAQLAVNFGTFIQMRPVTKHNREMIVFEFNDFPFGPTIAVTDKWMIVGLSSQTVEAFLLRLDGKLPRWAPGEQHQAALAGMPREFTSITIADPRETIRSLLSFAPMIIGTVQMGMNQMARFSGGQPSQLQIRASDIPPAELVTQPLFPNVSVGTVDQRGMHWRSRTSLPSVPLMSGIGGGSGVAVPATLVALLLPAVQQAREAARRTQSRNNLKQIGLALHNYHDVNKGFPAGTHPNQDLKTEKRLSWIADILPFLDQAPLHERIDFNKAWDDGANVGLMATRLQFLQNPGVVEEQESVHGTTHYVGIGGVGKDAPTLPVTDKRAGFFGYNRVTRMRDIRDGTSNTLAVSEAGKDFGPWGQGGKSTIRALTKKPYINGPDGIGGPSPGGCNMLLGDGSVRFISENIDPKVLESLSTVTGGEVVGDF